MRKSFAATFVFCLVLLTPVIQAQSLIFKVELDLNNQTLLATGTNLGPNPTVFMGNAAGSVDPLNVTDSHTSFVVADLMTTAPGTYVVLVVNGASVGFADVTIGPVGFTEGDITALGMGALVSNTTGFDNTATGRSALLSNTEGFRNTATGRSALRLNTTGDNNTATGTEALRSNTDGSFNTAAGEDALRSNTTGDNNTGTGASALQDNTTGFDNTATGVQALQDNSTGNSNTAIGASALLRNTTGAGNTATGADALRSNTDGFFNTATGNEALQSNGTGSFNTAMGDGAMSDNTTGGENTAMGVSALGSNTTGRVNTAVGRTALANNTTGSRNTAIGSNALNRNTTGTDNTALGRLAGFNQTTGSNNIYIDHVGNSGESNIIRIGDPGHTGGAFIAGVQVVAPSSRRFKKDIHDMDSASSGLMHLRPVTFRYKKAYADGERPLQYGLIAEEVAEVYPELVVRNDEGQVQTVQYHKLNSMLLNEVQKQNREIEKQAERMEAQQEQITGLTGRLARLEQVLTTQRSLAALEK